MRPAGRGLDSTALHHPEFLGFWPLATCTGLQWRQSALKSLRGRGSGSKIISIFSRQISDRFRFFLASSTTILIFPSKFQKNFDLFQEKIGHLQLLLGKLFYISSKVTTFEHTSCT